MPNKLNEKNHTINPKEQKKHLTRQWARRVGHDWSDLAAAAAAISIYDENSQQMKSGGKCSQLDKECLGKPTANELWETTRFSSTRPSNAGMSPFHCSYWTWHRRSSLTQTEQGSQEIVPARCLPWALTPSSLHAVSSVDSSPHQSTCPRLPQPGRWTAVTLHVPPWLTSGVGTLLRQE